MKNMVYIGCETTPKGIAELYVGVDARDKVYVTYFRRKTRRPITSYNNMTKNIIDELLVKVEKRLAKNKLTLWSY